MEGFLTPEQIAERLQIHPKTVRNMCQRGELPAIKVARQWRVLERDFAQWVEEQKGGE